MARLSSGRLGKGVRLAGGSVGGGFGGGGFGVPAGPFVAGFGPGGFFFFFVTRFGGCGFGICKENISN